MAAIPTSAQHNVSPLPASDIKQRQLSLPSQASPQHNAPLPLGWMEMRDPSGRLMYFNPSTGQTTWERPAVQQLPPGWQKAQTPDGKAIFIHTASGTVSYTAPAVAPAQPSIPGNVVQVQRTISVPQVTQVVRRKSEVKPQMARAMTAPVASPKNPNPTNVNVSVNMGVPLKAIPGAQQAYKIHQISENNNVQVLSKKLASDMATTTTTAASLVTRQAKTVGKTVISASKMQKVSKRMVVQTGALGVKAGRACKSMVNDMVDTADGKGKYAAKKQKKYVPFKAGATSTAALSVQVGAPHPTAPAVPQAPSGKPASGVRPMSVAVDGTVNVSLNAGVPARKPSRKPVPSSVTPNPTSPSQPSVWQEQAQLQYHNPDQKPFINILESAGGVLTSAQVEALQELQAQQLSQFGYKPNSEPRPTLQHAPETQQLPQSPTQAGLNMQAAIQANAGISLQHPQAQIQTLQQTFTQPPTHTVLQSVHPVQSQMHLQNTVQSQSPAQSLQTTIPPPTYQQAVEIDLNNIASHTQAQKPNSHATTSHATHNQPNSLIQPMIQLNLTGSSTDSGHYVQSSATHESHATYQASSHTSSHATTSDLQSNVLQHSPQSQTIATEQASNDYNLSSPVSPEPAYLTMDSNAWTLPQTQPFALSNQYTYSQQGTVDPISSEAAASTISSISDIATYQQQSVPVQDQIQIANESSSLMSATITNPLQLSYDQNYAYSYDYQPIADQVATTSDVVQSDAYATTTQTTTDVDGGGEIIYTESAYVDPSSGFAYAEEEIVYVDEDGNVIADQAAAAAMYVDGNGDVIYEEQDEYVEADDNGDETQEETIEECEVEEVDIDAGDFSLDF